MEILFRDLGDFLGFEFEGLGSCLKGLGYRMSSGFGGSLIKAFRGIRS